VAAAKRKKCDLRMIVAIALCAPISFKVAEWKQFMQIWWTLAQLVSFKFHLNRQKAYLPAKRLNFEENLMQKELETILE
jgi:hypothetical protein